ncbi:hypothetical protein F5888DRAFT_1699495 [Russula emetica]|nr:hypothetical protein F5888DRAFT_1733317 [Russula emetica]KAF8497619.1 hypothetical protein F5888DRAFT_1699495 [Russula emetica]
MSTGLKERNGGTISHLEILLGLETFCVAGQNKGISKLPIHLKLCSPNVLSRKVVSFFFSFSFWKRGFSPHVTC